MEPKGEEREYAFPKFRVVVKAKSPKEAEAKLKASKKKENE